MYGKDSTLSYQQKRILPKGQVNVFKRPIRLPSVEPQWASTEGQQVINRWVAKYPNPELTETGLMVNDDGSAAFIPRKTVESMPKPSLDPPDRSGKEYIRNFSKWVIDRGYSTSLINYDMYRRLGVLFRDGSETIIAVPSVDTKYSPMYLRIDQLLNAFDVLNLSSDIMLCVYDGNSPAILYNKDHDVVAIATVHPSFARNHKKVINIDSLY